MRASTRAGKGVKTTQVRYPPSSGPIDWFCVRMWIWRRARMAHMERAPIVGLSHYLLCVVASSAAERRRLLHLVGVDAAGDHEA